MKSNNNYVIVVTVDWHRVAVAYFVTSNNIFFDQNV